MIKIAICDDEVTILSKVKDLIKEYKKFPIEVSTFSSGEELLDSNIYYDIIILDIDMKGINGIDTAKKIREKDKGVRIIYLTNYTDYTIFAFNVHAFAYLLKPVDKDELFNQLDEALTYKFEVEGSELEFITLEGIKRLNVKDIFYFEYQNRIVKMITSSETFTLKKKITDICFEMKVYNFSMPHKSFVVNLYRVKAIKGYNIIMTDNTIIPLSQKKSTDFRKKLNCYLSEEIKRSRGVF